jgi:hypothetical protein
MMQQMGLPIMVPPEVVMAMRFIDMCNQATANRSYVWRDGDGDLAKVDLSTPDLHPMQEAAMRRACILLGRYFDGKGPRKQLWDK